MEKITEIYQSLAGWQVGAIAALLLCALFSYPVRIVGKIFWDAFVFLFDSYSELVFNRVGKWKFEHRVQHVGHSKVTEYMAENGNRMHQHKDIRVVDLIKEVQELQRRMNILTKIVREDTLNSFAEYGDEG